MGGGSRVVRLGLTGMVRGGGGGRAVILYTNGGGGGKRQPTIDLVLTHRCTYRNGRRGKSGKLDIMRGILEENSRPPSSPVSLRMYVLRLPDRDKTIESRSIDYLIFFLNRAENFFLQIGQYGYQKTQNFMLIPNPKTKLEKNT